MRFFRERIKKTVVYVIAVACLAWVLSGVRFGEMLGHMRNLHLWWILPALVLDILSTVAHGLRWQLLLRPFGSVKWLQTTQAVYACFFTNEIFPLKAGEAVRWYLMSRWMNLPFATILPSMITERVFDGSLLLAGLGVSAFFIELPQNITSAGKIVGIALLAVIGVLAVLAFFYRRFSTSRPPDGGERWTPVRHIFSSLSRFARALRTVCTSPNFWAALPVSLLFISLQMFAFWMVFFAYGLRMSFWIPAVVLIIVRLGTAVPNAPANIGSYQFFCVMSLMLFGIDKTTAAGLAIVLSVVFAIPLLTVGLLAFIRSGLTVSEFREVRRQMTDR